MPTKSAPARTSLSLDEPLLALPAVARPANLTRSLFHVASGVVSLGLLRLLPSRDWLIVASSAFALMAWSMEFARRRSTRVNHQLMRFFAPVAHAHERHQVNSSTWYVTGLLLLALFAPLRAAELGVLVLAVADPAAGFIGRRFGQTPLRAGRSLEGTLAFAAAGGIVSYAWLSLLYPSLPHLIAMACVGAAIGALAELASTKLDDNFTIPLSVAVGVALLERALS